MQKVEKRRKNFDLAKKHLEMLSSLQRMLNMNSESEAVRYCISQTVFLRRGICSSVLRKAMKSRSWIRREKREE